MSRGNLQDRVTMAFGTNSDCELLEHSSHDEPTVSPANLSIGQFVCVTISTAISSTYVHWFQANFKKHLSISRLLLVHQIRTIQHVNTYARKWSAMQFVR